MTYNELKNEENKYVMNTYGRFPIALDHGKGATLWDVEGKKYIDLASGIGVNCMGYDNQILIDAITQQAHKIMHASNLFTTEPMVQVAKKLVEKTHLNGKVFFANSGAESNEGAIKLARKYSFDKYGEGRYKIVTLVNSFHGRTVTTLKATGQDRFHNYFFPFTEGFDYAVANDIDDVRRKADDMTCAIMMELVQGEGGVLPLDQEFVKQVEALCREKDMLLIIDEVQTGIGRTGSLFCVPAVRHPSGCCHHGEGSRRRRSDRRCARGRYLLQCSDAGHTRDDLRRHAACLCVRECSARSCRRPEVPA